MKHEPLNFKFQELHRPVLLHEVLEYLNPQEGGVFIDATINGGGHAKAIVERIGKTGRLLGIDRDHELVEKLKVSSFPPKAEHAFAENIHPIWCIFSPLIII